MTESYSRLWDGHELRQWLELVLTDVEISKLQSAFTSQPRINQGKGLQSTLIQRTQSCYPPIYNTPIIICKISKND